MARMEVSTAMSSARNASGKHGTGTATAEPAGARPGPGGINVTISNDKLSVLLDCPDPLPRLDDTVTQVLAAIRKLQIPEYPDAEMLGQILTASARPGEAMVAQPLIMGYAAEPPQNGRLEWMRDYFVEGWEIDPQTGAINFWAKLDNRAVAAGELLLKLHPPVPGEPGLNVFGAKIPVGKPQKERMRCGKGVTQEVDAQEITYYRAEVAGRVRVNDGTLSVDDVYIIKGNVDLANGNVRHTGTLQIEGDIEQGVSIEVDGDIAVRGMIEPCNIKVGGNLQVAGGIVGQEGFRILVGGSVQARYMRDVELDAIGDVSVGSEISHAQIRTLGRVLVPNGRIAGGTTIARSGITVGQAGASGATGTVLIAGIDYLIEPRVAQMEQELAVLEKNRQQARDAIDQMRAAPHTVADDDAILELDRQARKLGQAMADGEASIKKSIAESEAACHPEIAALTEVWSGTTIQLRNERMPVRASVRKPRLARLLNSHVRLLPLGNGNMPDDD
jgi:uncharacterized protein (DUF342 family)